MRKLILLALVLSCAGCCGPFHREAPTVMYRDGWGGTAVVIPSPCNPIPYAAAMPSQPVPGVWAPQEPASTLTTGWYVDDHNQWRPQRWVRLGTSDRSNPTYVAVYP